MARKTLSSWNNLTESSRNTRESVQYGDMIEWIYDDGTNIKTQWAIQTITQYSASLAAEGQVTGSLAEELVSSYSSSYSDSITNYRTKV